MDTSTQPPADLITPTEAARLIPGVRPGKSRHLATVYRWVNEGRLRAWRVGRSKYVSRSEVLALIQPAPPKRPRAGREDRGPTRQQLEAQTRATLREFGLEK